MLSNLAKPLQGEVAELDRILTTAEVLKATGISQISLTRFVERGIFPKPIRFNNYRIGWLQSEVLAWYEAKKAERELTPAKTGD